MNGLTRATQPGTLRAKIFVGVFFVLVTTLVVAVVVMSRTVPLDDGTQCPAGHNPANVVIMLLDQSDQFEKLDIQRTQALMTRVLQSLEFGDKLVVVEPNATSSYEPAVLFERCAPKNLQRVNALFDKVKEAEDRAKAFKDAFWSGTANAFARTSAPRSPLLETFAYLVQRPDYIVAQRRSVYVFSDMLQFSDVADFYKSVPDAALADSRLHALRVDFRRAPVFIGQVARRKLWTTRPLVAQFWDGWVRDHNGEARWDFMSAD
jgi:hypothetical protein